MLVSFSPRCTDECAGRRPTLSVRKEHPMKLQRNQIKTKQLKPTKFCGRYAKDLKMNWQLYVMMLLPMIWLVIFHYVPLYGIQLAFKKFNSGLGIWGSNWAGGFYFKRFFSSPWFFRTLKNTLRISLYSIIMGTPLPIILALALNCVRNRYFKKTVQMVTYLPHFISTVVLVSMMELLFNSRVGILGQAIASMTDGKVTNLMGSAAAFPHLYVWSSIWQSTGWGTIIYLAALAGVSPDQTEAAIIDGTTRFQRVWYIDLPTIMPTIIITFILRMGSIMGVGYEKTLLMQNNLNLETSEIITTYSYKVGLLVGNGDFSYGMAIGLFNSVINMIVLLVFNRLSKVVSETSLW